MRCISSQLKGTTIQIRISLVAWKNQGTARSFPPVTPQSNPTFTHSPIRPEVWPSICHICHICHSRQWMEAAKPVLYLGSGAAESSMAINPVFFAWQCAKSPCYPVFSWFKYHNVQSFKKVLLLITSYKSRLQVKIPELMTLAGRTCCCQRGPVQQLDRAGRLSFTVDSNCQPDCLLIYNIYIFTHPEGPYFDGCIIHPVIIIPIFSWVQSSYSCWNVLISWLKRDIHTYMIYIYIRDRIILLILNTQSPWFFSSPHVLPWWLREDITIVQFHLGCYFHGGRDCWSQKKSLSYCWLRIIPWNPHGNPRKSLWNPFQNPRKSLWYESYPHPSRLRSTTCATTTSTTSTGAGEELSWGLVHGDDNLQKKIDKVHCFLYCGFLHAWMVLV